MRKSYIHFGINDDDKNVQITNLLNKRQSKREEKNAEYDGKEKEKKIDLV